MDMFAKIKRQNSETFAHTIRKHDSGLFEIPDLDKILQYAGRNGEVLKNFLSALKKIEIQEQVEHKNPFDLLSQAGYDAFLADTLEKQNSIIQHFAPDEEICTFRDATRFENFYIIHCVKRGADKIKRSKKPTREDPYGTSVISIQISKNGGQIFITNRYNHTVMYADNTFSSNPDNIILGLSDALRHHFDVDFASRTVALPDNYIEINNQIIHFHHAVNNVCFGDSFYTMNGGVIPINPKNQVVLDYFVFDIKERKLLDPAKTNDPFIEIFNQHMENKKIEIKKQSDNTRSIYLDGAPFMEFKDNQITSLNLPGLENAGDNFLQYNRTIKQLNLPKLKNAGKNFLRNNKSLTEISLPELEIAGDNFLRNNEAAAKLNVPKLKNAGDYFLYDNSVISQINASELQTVKYGFLYSNTALAEVQLNKLESAGDDFLQDNKIIRVAGFAKLTMAGHNFMIKNQQMEKINLLSLTQAGNGFLERNVKLTELNAPDLTSVESNFLMYNEIISSLNLPQLKTAGDNFLRDNRALSELNLPELKSLGKNIMEDNTRIRKLHLPKLESTMPLFELERKIIENKNEQFRSASDKLADAPITTQTPPIIAIDNNQKD